MAITLDEAKALYPGQTIYHTYLRNADGSPQRWMVNGQPKTWKRSPERVEVPVKYGLYVYGYLTQNDLDLVCLTEEDVWRDNPIEYAERYG